MRRPHLPFARPVLLALAPAACGDSSNPDNGPAATPDIGEVARDEVETSLDALTVSASLAPLGTGTGCAAASSTTDPRF